MAKYYRDDGEITRAKIRVIKFIQKAKQPVLTRKNVKELAKKHAIKIMV